MSYRTLTNVSLIHYSFAAVILVLAFLLRAHNYWIVPLSDETADELAWTWLGASLLTEGQPTAWSFYSQYENGYIYKQGIVNAPLVRPAVDHPPLFSLIPGAMHALTSDNWETIPSRKVIRLPMIFLGAVNVLLLYAVARKLFTPAWSLVSMSLYATAPLFVLSSRLVVAENLLITWMLLFILTINAWINTTHKQNLYSVLLILISIAATLTKISGIVLPVALIVFALLNRSAKLRTTGLIALSASVATLLLYMTAVNLPMFLSIQASQASRLLGLTTLYSRFFIHPAVAKLAYFDGWLVLGFIALVVQISQFAKSIERPKLIVLLHLLSLLCLGFIVTTVEEFSYHGWYNYQLFPLFAVALTQLAQIIFAGNSLLASLAWILLLPTINSIFTQLHIRDQVYNLHIRALYFVGFLPLAADILHSAKFRQYSFLFLFGLILLANSISVLSVTELSIRENNNYYFFVLPKTVAQ